MRKELVSICLVALGLKATIAFSPPSPASAVLQQRRSTSSLSAASENDEAEPRSLDSRRSFLLGAGLMTASLLSNQQPAFAAADTTTSTAGADTATEAPTTDKSKQPLFNDDGSLKEAEVEEVKLRTVTASWPSSSSSSESDGKYLISVDGKTSDSGSAVRVSYQLPEKWQQKDNGYFDKSTTNLDKACEKITVYRAPGKVTPERLAKAANIGVGEALYVTDELKKLRGADLLSGRTRKQGDLKFYDFDMATAPKECEMSAENLGLGFCPFDTIYLISAVVVDDALYVMTIESDKSEWKVASADLKRARSSFAFNVAS